MAHVMEPGEFGEGTNVTDVAPNEALNSHLNGDAGVAQAGEQFTTPIAGHWDTDEGAEMANRYVGLTREELAYGYHSDLKLANDIFMADRTASSVYGDLSLISLQTAAKERIRWLSAQLAAANIALSRRAANTTGTVKVKALEWHGPDYEDEYWAQMTETRYVIGAPNGNGRWLSTVGGYFQTVDEAKAAAQADFNQRILSSLEPASSVEGEEPVAGTFTPMQSLELTLRTYDIPYMQQRHIMAKVEAMLASPSPAVSAEVTEGEPVIGKFVHQRSAIDALNDQFDADDDTALSFRKEGE